MAAPLPMAASDVSLLSPAYASPAPSPSTTPVVPSPPPPDTTQHSAARPGHVPNARFRAAVKKVIVQNRANKPANKFRSAAQLVVGRVHATRKDHHQKIYKNPAETTRYLMLAGVKKSYYAADRLFLLAVLAGVFVSIGGCFAISVGFGLSPAVAANYPGIQKLLSGVTFSTALMFILIAGGELFTGNIMFMSLALVARRITILCALYNWIIVFFGNFVGCVLGGYVLGYCTEFYKAEPWHSALINYAKHKVELEPDVVFTRSLGANFCVCLAVFFMVAAEDIPGKILGAIFPVAAFAAVGFEHSVANMFYVPLSMMYGSNINFGVFIYRNLLLVVLGNFIGGAGLALMLLYFYNRFSWEEVNTEHKRRPLIHLTFLPHRGFFAAVPRRLRLAEESALHVLHDSAASAAHAAHVANDDRHKSARWFRRVFPHRGKRAAQAGVVSQQHEEF